MKRANELAQISGARVYYVVLYYGQLYTYTSHDTEAWPPSQDEIVSTLRSLQVLKEFADRQIGPELSPSKNPHSDHLSNGRVGMPICNTQ